MTTKFSYYFSFRDATGSYHESSFARQLTILLVSVRQASHFADSQLEPKSLIQYDHLTSQLVSELLSFAVAMVGEMVIVFLYLRPLLPTHQPISSMA